MPKPKRQKVFASTPLAKMVPFAPTPNGDASMASVIKSDESFDRTNTAEPPRRTGSNAKRGLANEFDSSTMNQTTINESIEMEPIDEETDESNCQLSSPNDNMSSMLLSLSSRNKSKSTRQLATSANSCRHNTKEISEISGITDSLQVLNNADSLLNTLEHSVNQTDASQISKLQVSSDNSNLTEEEDKENHETELESLLLPDETARSSRQSVPPRSRRNIGFNDSLSIHEVSRRTNNSTAQRLSLPSVRVLMSIKGGKWRRSVYQFKRELADSKYRFI